MSKLDNFRFKCIHCGNCCTDKNTLVNVTFQDIIRIKKALDLNAEEIKHILGFFIFEDQPTKEDMKKMVVSPIETERGLAFAGLRKYPDGSCYFYDKQKNRCRIYNARPNFCRTFPFSFEIIELKDNNKANIKIKYTQKGKEYCEGIGNDFPLIEKQKWFKLGQKTIESLNENYHIMKKWNEQVKNEDIEPSVDQFIEFIFRINNRD